MVKKSTYDTRFFDKKTRDEEREQVKSLVSLLPKIKVQSQKENFLETLDDADKKRFLLREYFTKLKRKPRPPSSPFKRLSWLVTSSPFPQLFEYREGDDELFADCNAVKFTNFLSAYKLYKKLMKFEYDKVASMSKASFYCNPRKEGDKTV